MFGIGGFELFIILLFGFLIFGPDKLPEIAKTVGTAISKFKKAQDEMSAVLKSEVLEASSESDKKSQSNTNKTSDESTGESFAERKARYDKERAERKQKKELEENRAAMRKNSAEHARNLEEQIEEESKENKAGEKHEAGEKESSKPAITADQLYGNVPIKPAPKTTKTAVADKATPQVIEEEPESHKAADTTAQASEPTGEEGEKQNTPSQPIEQSRKEEGE